MILIVGDIKANIIALKKTLEIHDLEIDFAESGAEALKKILKNDYSLIIMDVQMPGMDGFEIVENLSGSNRTRDIPVLFLSAANKEKKFISKGYESGGVDYIIKPVDPDLLILKVKSFLKIFQQQKELKKVRDLLSTEVEARILAQENLEIKVRERTKELVEKNKELELSNHELQQFSWIVSHDLKEPLRKIQIFNNLIKDKYLEHNIKGVEYINRTIKSAERMQNLISDLLEYSRLSADVDSEKANLNELVQEVVTDLDFLIEEKKATITVSNLPTIKGIPTQLRQVFHNLIENSLKFAREGVLPIVQINSELIKTRDFDSVPSDSGKFCRITVKDNGIGFDVQYLNKIFMIFQSLSDRSVYEGTGIGLAIAKKIIEKHNGVITAKSAVWEGASFIMLLPLDSSS